MKRCDRIENCYRSYWLAACTHAGSHQYARRRQSASTHLRPLAGSGARHARERRSHRRATAATLTPHRRLYAALHSPVLGTSATSHADPTMSAWEGQSRHTAKIVGGPSLTHNGLTILRHQ